VNVISVALKLYVTSKSDLNRADTAQDPYSKLGRATAVRSVAILVPVTEAVYIALHGKTISELRGRHVPYGITQCYLPPDTSERAPP